MTDDSTPTDETLIEDSTPENSSDLESARPRLGFTIETTTYEAIRTLEWRGNGEVVLLAERHLPH
ncbi:MAG: serine/threonine protein kinase, partial [Verrucomicrobiaceae bacterium]